MKFITALYLLASIALNAQTINTKLISKTPFTTDEIINISENNTIYHLINNSLIKIKDNKNLSYSNLKLGKISSANTFNPLKINIFYSDFNTTIILDNRLAEIFKIDFNLLEDYKNVSHISTGADNTIWIFDQNTQQLELFDYKTTKIRNKSLPITSEVKTIVSNYNYCWLLTNDYLYCYSYFGSLVYKIKNDNYKDLKIANEQCIVLKNEKLFFITKDTHKLRPIDTQNVSIKQFFVTNQTLYIYDNNYIYNFIIK